MNQVPSAKNDPLCRRFKRIARKTWRDLRDSNQNSIGLGEESITDYLLLDLARSCGNQVAIQKFTKPQEGSTTGADWEFWFVSRGRGFGMRVQAKRLDSASLSYASLEKTAGKNGPPQIDLLLEDAANQNPALFPAYLFYNHWPKGAIAPRWNCQSSRRSTELLGCAVCSAHEVKRLLIAGTATTAAILGASLPWSCLVCCTQGRPPQATQLPERAAAVSLDLSRPVLPGGPAPRPSETDLPRVTDDLPVYVRAIMSRRAVGREQTAFEYPRERNLDGVAVYFDPQ